MPGTPYPQPERRAWFIEEAETRMRQQPGVVAAGAASALPLSHEGSEMDPPFTIVGVPAPAPGDEPTALTTFVTPGYFDAIGMRLVQGRLLNDRDTATAPAVIVVNETMARHSWPGESPIGKRITSSLSFAGRGTREIVGVVGVVGEIVAAAGVAGGLIASVALTRYLGAMRFGVTARDPATFVALAAVMSIVSALACYVPARRAVRVDPLTAIRAE